MPTYEKIKGGIALASNSPYAATGYGVQTKHLIDMFTRHGIHTAVLSNYGLEGSKEKLTTPYGKVAHYPKGLSVYSEDVMPIWFQEFAAQQPDLKHVLMTLYDVWVYNNLKFDGPIYSWVPLDHVTLPPRVRQFLMRDNVTPIAMSPHGQRQLTEAKIESVYIPHSVDLSVMKPTHKVNGMATRKFMDVPDDVFLVTMVSANKANKLVHRKALAEQLLAFSMFHRKFPDSRLYLHMEPSPVYGGFNLPILLQAVGLSAESVIIADSNQLRVGYDDKDLAAFYTASDVLMIASYGEGFGVPIIEAQACGTKVITSSWSATQDLVSESSWLVDGQPFWDEPQSAFYNVPLIDSIVAALQLAYESERGVDQASIDFAKDFGTEKVTQDYWLPFLRSIF